MILKPDSLHRMYTYQNYDGRMIRVRRQIKDANELKLCIPSDYKNVYESVCTWYGTPWEVRGVKSKYKTANNLLKTDTSLILIDIDSKDKKNLLKVHNYFKTKQYYFWKLIKSGGGYHYYIKPKTFPSIADPKERITRWQTMLGALAADMQCKKLNIDYQVLTDIYRVSRVIGSRNGNKRAYCLETDINKELDEARTLCRDEKRFFPSKTHKVSLPTKTKAAHKFIKNNVEGTRLFIPVLVRRSLKWHMNKQKQYGLGPLYIFKHKDRTISISLNCYTRERMLKVMKGSENYNTFLKYKQVWIQTSKEVNDKGVEEAPRYIGMLEGMHLGAPLSKPHYNWLKEEYGVAMNTDCVFLGKDKNKEYVKVWVKE